MYLASGKLAAVMLVAIILQDCLARHTVFVLAKPCAYVPSFTKHDENEARHDNEDEGDSMEEEGS